MVTLLVSDSVCVSLQKLQKSINRTIEQEITQKAKQGGTEFRVLNNATSSSTSSSSSSSSAAKKEAQTDSKKQQ